MNLEFESDNELVVGTTDYNLNNTTLKKVIKSAVVFAKENNCRKILFDHTASVLEASIIELFNITADLSVFGMTKDFRCAVIYNSEGEKYEFSEQVINNRSNPIVKFFDDINEGRSWLLDIK